MGSKLSCSSTNKEDKNDKPYGIAVKKDPCVEVESVEGDDRKNVEDGIAVKKDLCVEAERVEGDDRKNVEECLEESDEAEIKQQSGNVINFYTIQANHVNVAISDGTIQESSENISSDLNDRLKETMPVQVSNDLNDENNPWVEQKLAVPNHTIKETCEERPCMEVPPSKYADKNVQSSSLPETLPVQVSKDLKTWEDREFALPNQTSCHCYSLKDDKATFPSVDETCNELKSSDEKLTDKIIQSIKKTCEDLNCTEEQHSNYADKNFQSNGSCEVDGPSSFQNNSDRKCFSILCIRTESTSGHGSRDGSEMQIKKAVNNTCHSHPELHETHDEHLFGCINENRPAKHSAIDDGNDGQLETGYNVDSRNGQNEMCLNGNDDCEEDKSRVTEDRETGVQLEINPDESTEHNSQDEVENEGEQRQNERSCENKGIADAIEVDAEIYSVEFDRESVKEGDKDGKSTSKNYVLEWVSDSMTKLSDLSKDGTGKVLGIAKWHENNDEVKTECAKEIGKTTRNAVDNMADITERVAIQCLQV